MALELDEFLRPVPEGDAFQRIYDSSALLKCKEKRLCGQIFMIASKVLAVDIPLKSRPI